ncbi:MAG: cobalt transporter CbiM [Coriobacteriia bacterium]
MHIPDGYLGPQTYAVLDVAIIPIWGIAASRVKKTLKTKQVPLMALAAAFSFVIMMFNVPVIGGSTGHAVGATLIAIVLGPWAACISVSIALVIQALLFGDGGITAIGANVFNMAVVMPFVGYYLYRLIAGDSAKTSRKVVASGIAAYVSIVVGATVAGVMFGIQPLIAHTAAGAPLYAPYPLKIAVTAMFTEHILFFGWVEALATMGVVAALAKQDSALLDMKPASKPLRWLWASLAVLALLTPIGALASGTAWGEWSVGQFTSELNMAVPPGLERLNGMWSAAIPDYAPAFIRNPRLGYLLAAIIGSACAIGIAWGIAKLLTRGKGSGSAGIPPDAA